MLTHYATIKPVLCGILLKFKIIWIKMCSFIILLYFDDPWITIWLTILLKFLVKISPWVNTFIFQRSHDVRYKCSNNSINITSLSWLFTDKWKYSNLSWKTYISLFVKAWSWNIIFTFAYSMRLLFINQKIIVSSYKTISHRCV